MNELIRIVGQSQPRSVESVVTGPAFRDGMSLVAGAVHVVTTGGIAGAAGYTATAVTSLTDDPPTLLACLNKSSRTLPRVMANGVFAVNTLSAGQTAVADVFAGRQGQDHDERFAAAGEWHSGLTGAPLLAGALVSFECRVVEAKTVSTHVILIGTVAAVTTGPSASALVYHRRRYTTLSE
jgi:flavin reductase